MAIMLKRQLTDQEKQRILKVHGRSCFATGHPIGDDEIIQFDHIKAFTASGVTELDNIAPMCELHNKSKGTLPLYDYRVKLRLDDFFSSGDKLTLGDLLRYMKGKKDIPMFGEQIVIDRKDDKVLLEYDGKQIISTLHACPVTKWEYFYATFPIEIIDSDDNSDTSLGLQPRYLLFDKLFEMFRHFQWHPVLQPSIGRILGKKILIFDGQHKIASLLWTGRRDFECKIYINPDIRLLNLTNIAAHDKYSQTRFFSSIMVGKLGTEFGIEFEQYKKIEDGQGKSETGFVRFLNSQQTETRGEINKKFRSFLYNLILKSEDNKLTEYVSPTNRGTDDCPLTMDMFSKSLFVHFLYREPVEDLIATDEYKREFEIQNVITLMNYLYELAMCNWNPQAGPNDFNQIKLKRLFSSKSIMAWSDILKNAICGKLDLQDSTERTMPFYRYFDDKDKSKIKNVVERLLNWKMWVSPSSSDIDRILSDNVSVVGNWFRNNGLTTGYLMGAPE